MEQYYNVKSGSKPIVVEASAGRIVDALSNSGYSLPEAIADILDNSISAKAKKVIVKFEQGPPPPGSGGKVSLTIYIGDDGEGMDREEIIQCLKYGSEFNKKDPTKLSKFGVGLKASASSFASILTVISKKQKKSPNQFTWDFEKVKKENKWLLQETDISDRHEKMFNSLPGRSTKDTSGTLIILENVKSIKLTPQSISRQTMKVEEHLAKVFHKFLDPKFRDTRDVSIYYNGIDNDSLITPWNPFFPKYSEKLTKDQHAQLSVEGSKEKFTLIAYLLPEKDDEMVKTMAKESMLHKHLDTVQRNQGFYIHRENRIIQQDPNWLEMFAQISNTRFLRVDLSFTSALDDQFGINHQKNKIDIEKIEGDIREKIKDNIKHFYHHANQVNRDGQARRKNKTTESINKTTNTLIELTPSLKSKTEIKNIDHKKKEVTIKNQFGVFTTSYASSDGSEKDFEIHVKSQENIHDDLLWELSYDTEKKIPIVLINKSHNFFKKIYCKHLNDDKTIQAINLLLYTLAQAEADALSEGAIKSLKYLKKYVSRSLSDILEEFPDVDDVD